MPYPLPLTRTEAYLAYKAGVIQQSDLKPSLAVPRNGIDAWLAYWTGLAADYPKREDGTPHILQEEEAYIAYLCGVVSEYPEKCLRRVGAYLRYLISARWGRPDHPLNREELYLSLIKTQFIPSGDPSSDITIDGTAKAPFVDVKMYGDTFQQSYTGKNMIGFPTRSYEQHGLTFDFNTDGTITINGTRSETSATNYNSSVLFNFSAGSITFTIIPISGSFSGANIGYRAIAGSEQSWYQIVSSGGGYNQGTINKTAEQVARITRIELLIGSGSAVFDNFKFKLQVTAGSDHDTDYEPFVGGQASPNPDYPQQIQTVTGEQTVTVEGKNILSSTWEGGTYNISTGDKQGNADSYRTSEKIAVKPNTAYIVSRNSVAIAINYFEYDENGSFVAYTYKAANQAITTSPTTKFITMSRGLTGGIEKMMLESGSTVTTYAPYSKQTLPINLGSIELCKLGTYQDYIYKDGDDWKVHKEIGYEKKIVSLAGIDGYSSVYGTATTSNGAFAIISTNWGSDYATTAGVAIASSVIGVYQSQNIDGNNSANSMVDGSFCQRSGTNDRVYFRFASWARSKTVDEVNQMVTDNGGIDLWYPLATPTDTTITDTTLIEQLEALKNGGAENGTTYIKVSASDPNLPGLLYVEAPKYE